MSQNNATYDARRERASWRWALRAATSRSPYYNFNYNPRPTVNAGDERSPRRTLRIHVSPARLT